MLVTIVIPTHNRAELLRPTLESVLRQTCRDFECIVVDDGGSDSTAELVRSFGDPRLRYTWKPHGERGAARNYGAARAAGEYVYFLDSDDLLSEDHLEHGLAELSRLGMPGVLYSRHRVRSASTGYETELPVPRDLQRAMLRRNQVGSCLYVQRRLTASVPYVEDKRFRLGEDWLHALELMSCEPIRVTARATRVVQQHPGRSMNSAGSQFLQAREVLLRYAEASPHLHSLGAAARSEVLRSMRGELTSLAAVAYASHEPGKACLLMAEAAATCPWLLRERRSATVLLRATRGLLAAQACRASL